MKFSAEALEFLRDSGLWLILSSAVMTALLLESLRPLMTRYAIARPNARSSHTAPTPQGAGAAVVAVTIAGASVALHLSSGGAPTGIWLVFAAIVFVAFVGAIDDLRSIAVMPRLALQAVSVGVVVAALPDAIRVFPSLPLYAERGLMFLAGLWFVNLTNFMDGLDWMTVAEIVPVSAGLAFAALLGGLPIYALVVALTLCGAMLGFAPFNKPVARMFLGDVGSLPIGLLIGWLLVLLAGAGHFTASFLLPLYYVADATLTLARRVRNGEAVWQAHRTHFYQRATDRGFRVIRVVAQVFTVNVLLAMLAILTIAVPTYPVAIGAVSVGVVLVGALLLNFVHGNILRG